MTLPKDRGRDAADVRTVVEALFDAVRRKDIDAMLAHCAPGLATFDLFPPLAHKGKAEVREVWSEALAAFEGPVEYVPRDIEMTVGEDVAFVRCLARLGGRRLDGTTSMRWFRSTFGFQKLAGRWKLVHEHVSVPCEMETGRAMFDLEPEFSAGNEEGSPA